MVSLGSYTSDAKSIVHAATGARLGVGSVTRRAAAAETAAGAAFGRRLQEIVRISMSLHQFQKVAIQVVAEPFFVQDIVPR